MRFIDNKGREIPSLSTLKFAGEPWNLADIKDRFNRNFVRNTQVRAVYLSFIDNHLHAEFLAGIRNGAVVIVNTKTKQEYTSKEFSSELNTVDQVINSNTFQP